MKKPVFFLIPLFFFGCSQRELPPQNSNHTTITLNKHVLPEVVNPGETYLVSVQLTGGADVDSVRLDVYRQGQSNLFTSYALFDDGGTLYSNDGDQVAFDGYYTQNITWVADAGDEQAYLWRFEATDVEGKNAEPFESTVVSRQNVAPVLLKVEAPDSLPSGFEGELVFQADVSDSNGLADISAVSYSAYKDNVLNFEAALEMESPGVYAAKMIKSFAVGKVGLYDVRFKAVDKSGLLSNVISKNVFIGNNAPQLLDFVHVDSVQIPETGKMVAFLITVRVDDDQSLADVKEVKLEWKKPDSTYSANSPFDLYDNGLPWNETFEGWDDGWRGDAVAGDGIYSITGIFDLNQPLGDYELTFYARDYAGNMSGRVTRILTLYAREGN
jgi:hypothetical protein